MLRASNAEFSICACSVQMVVTGRCLKKWEPITEKEERLRMDWNTVAGKCVLLLCEKKEGKQVGRSGGL